MPLPDRSRNAGDHAPGLHDALCAHGFVHREPDSVMIGEARAMAVDVPLPGGVTLRESHEEANLRATAMVQRGVSGEGDPDEVLAALLRRQSRRDGMELWVAEGGGRIVCAGRLEPVVDSEFAGLWGAATVPEWRGRGLYRALTGAHARSALRAGKTLVHSDSRQYVWHRPAGDG